MWPTKIVAATNTMYVKKSPGWVNFGEAVSSLLPCVYTRMMVSNVCVGTEKEQFSQKYVSNSMPRSGPVMRKEEMRRHS
jgi:hypothetical protein